MNKNLEKKEINGFTFFKPKFKKDWVISGIDICKYLGYKNPYKQANQIYDRYKEYFTKTSHLLILPRSKKMTKGIPQSEVPLLDQNYQEVRCYTRPGCWFFVAQCRIPIALKLIEKLFKSFDDLLKILDSKNTLDWKQEREKGKVARRKFTDAVQLFVEYCQDQGSKHADMYYTNLTKTIYAALGYDGKVPKNFRNNMSAYELAVLNLLEISSDQDLYDLMDRNIPYKEIFQEVKASIIRKTMNFINKEKEDKLLSLKE